MIDTIDIGIRVPFCAGNALDDGVFAAIRRRVILEHCKWDPQVEDVCTLAPFPLIIQRERWAELSHLAEQLTAEALAAEHEILCRPELIAELGIPKPIRRLFRSSSRSTPAAARVMRFDFHFTTDGWRISEVNSDVPGGFSEASSFTEMMAQYHPGMQPTGNPIVDWSAAIAASAGNSGTVALLSAPGYMEDHQVIGYVAQHLRKRGCRVHLAGPTQVQWADGNARLDSAWYRGRVDAIVRFYQGEWLARLRGNCDWSPFFCEGNTPVANPGIAIITETKRFPIVWDKLDTQLPTWKKLLPQTCDPRDVNWQNDDQWIVKSALCNTGDTVSIRPHLSGDKWRDVVRGVGRCPEEWVAQKRFEPVWFPTPMGQMHACIGVYTVNGFATGSYTRITDRPIIDYSAIDAALLVETENHA